MALTSQTGPRPCFLGAFAGAGGAGTDASGRPGNLSHDDERRCPYCALLRGLRSVAQRGPAWVGCPSPCQPGLEARREAAWRPRARNDPKNRAWSRPTGPRPGAHEGPCRAPTCDTGPSHSRWLPKGCAHLHVAPEQVAGDRTALDLVGALEDPQQPQVADLAGRGNELIDFQISMQSVAITRAALENFFKPYVKTGPFSRFAFAPYFTIHCFNKFFYN